MKFCICSELDKLFAYRVQSGEALAIETPEGKMLVVVTQKTYDDLHKDLIALRERSEP